MPLRFDTCRDSRRRLSGRAQLEGLFRTPSWLNNFAGCLFLVRRMRKDGIPATSKLWDLSHKLCAATVSAEDRWKIVAYIRALQLSQNASTKDVPQGQKVPSQPPKFAEPGSGATLPIFVPETKSEGQEKVER